MRIAIVSRCARTLAVFRTSLIQGAMAQGHSVVAMGAGGDGFETHLQGAGIKFTPVPISFSGISPASDLRLIAVLRRAFRTFRPDVVHAFTIKPAIFATLAAALAGVPVRVVTVTGLGYAFTSAGGLLRGLVEFLYRRSLGSAHRVFFQNSTDLRLFVERRLVDPAKARLVAGSGVDLRKFSPVPLPSSAQAPLVFLMIGRLLRDKGVLEYLDAAQIVRVKHPGVRFLLLGAEDSRNPSRLTPAELVRLRASHVVELLNEVDDVRPVIARADVIVLPSYREGLPRSLLEGAAMGRPLIAADVPGCNEVVRNGSSGFLVPRGDAARLAEAMLQFSADPTLLARFGAAALADVRARFDEAKVIGDTLSTYRELLEAND